MKQGVICVACAIVFLALGCGSTGTNENPASDAGVADAPGGGSDGASPADATPAVDGGNAPDTGGPLPSGKPIDAPAGTWTWVPFPDAFCANGSATGIGVNLSKASSRVILYLEGGGACWSEATCYSLMTAANFVTGYGASNFAAESTNAAYLASPGGFFDRTAAGNPFKDYSYVYVPYCTGDLHAGSNVVQYGTHTAKHVGAQNMAAYLNRIVPTFAAAERVYISGSSAGGFGAVLNWWQTQRAFGSVRVDLIDDSGTFMPSDIQAMGNHAETIQSAQWNLAAAVPPGCTECMTSLAGLYGYYAKEFPKQRGALLSYTRDSVLPKFGALTEAQFTAGLNEDIATQFAPNANLKVFTNDAAAHVLLFTPMVTTKNVTLQHFLTQMVTDDAAWASVQP